MGDFNDDNQLDYAVAFNGSNQVQVGFGNGDGSFDSSLTIATGANPGSTRIVDFNGDGIDDLLVSTEGAGAVEVILSNGDGTFKASTSVAVGTTPFTSVGADFDGDGAIDLAVANNGSGDISIAISNSENVTTAALLDLTTREGALEAMAVIDANLDRVNSERGAIGAVQSRLTVAVQNLQVGRENYVSARSQITDVDVARESANLVKAQILQQAGASVLAQANQLPALALNLLNSV